MTLFAEGHNWTETAKVEATCKNPGSASYKCDKCSAEYTVTEPQKDHAVKSTVVLPTCTQRGYTEIACVMCDYKSIIDIKRARKPYRFPGAPRIIKYIRRNILSEG